MLSPVNSLESAKMQILAGANEIYVGIKSELYKRYSFSGRGQSSKNDKIIVMDIQELNKIVEFAHKNNVEVSLAANVSMFSDYGNKKFEEAYIDDITKAVEIGVDNIIIGDLGLLYKISNLHLPVNLHASTYFDTLSVAQLEFLKTLGVKRAVLSYHSHIDEIKKLCAAKIMEIEVFAYLSCSFFNGSCNMVHDMGEKIQGEKVQMGVPCKAEYCVTSNGGSSVCCNYMDADLACGLCAMKELLDAGVDVVKIAGRDRDSAKIAMVTELFRKAIDLANRTDSEYDKEAAELAGSWWKKIYCSNNRCKYKKNPVIDSYIGI